MTAAVYAVCAAIFLRDAHSFWNPTLFEGVALGTVLVVMGGSLTKMAALRQGGSAVADMLGGRPVNTNTSEPDERKLLNVVEEMAIASGIPVPQVYLLENEEGINAFAAGTSVDDAVVGVTRGCMTLLNRDELQGVIAHEFSHILNGDMRLNLRLIGLVFGIFCLAQVGRILLQSSSRRSRGNRKESNPLPLLGFALLVIGSIGVFFGRLIKSAVSRQREFLADAAAVQFTRNPMGLAGALKKIGGYTAGSRIEDAHAEEVSHLFFSNGLASSWMSTHPPLDDRIRRLDPAFDGKFAAVLPPKPPEVESYLAERFTAAPKRLQSAEPLRVESVAQLVGTPTPNQIAYAANFRDELPQVLQAAAHEPMSAVALVYGLLLSSNEQQRAIQWKELQSSAEPGMCAEVKRLAPELSRLQLEYRLPLVQLALPALARLSPKQYLEFERNLQHLIQSDQEVDLFEYALQKVVRRHLDVRFRVRPPPVVQFYSLKPLLPDCAVLLSILAHSGHEDPVQAQKAFANGAQRFGSGNQIEMLDISSCGLGEVDRALNRLAQASPAIQKAVIEACARAVATDNVIQVYEAELLRAIGDSLNCPIPPFIQGV